MRIVGFLLCSALFATSLPDNYKSEIESWRAKYEEGLKAPGGWLSVAGLFWLHEGDNTVGSDPKSDVVLPAPLPAHAGVVNLQGNVATYNGQPLTAKAPAVVGDVSLIPIERNHKFAIRMKDPNAETRQHFTGNKWFPVREAFRVEAQWVPYTEPKTTPIQSILGYTENEAVPGYAEFTLHGKTFRLEPVVEEPGSLFFIFKDLTAGHETYGAGRFLDTADPKDGKVILDFNQAYNPPCAFTAFATCPLPPRQNHLAVRIEAGARKYGNH